MECARFPSHKDRASTVLPVSRIACGPAAVDGSPGWVQAVSGAWDPVLRGCQLDTFFVLEGLEL
jgi:hypothetical protein